MHIRGLIRGDRSVQYIRRLRGLKHIIANNQQRLNALYHSDSNVETHTSPTRMSVSSAQMDAVASSLSPNESTTNAHGSGTYCGHEKERIWSHTHRYYVYVSMSCFERTNKEPLATQKISYM